MASSDYGPIDSGLSATNVTLTSADLSNLRTAGTWGRVLAILAIVGLFMGIVIAVVFTGAMGSMMMGDSDGIGLFGGWFFAVYFLAILAVYAYPTFKLYQFSTQAVRAANVGSSAAASESIGALKSLFKYIVSCRSFYWASTF